MPGTVTDNLTNITFAEAADAAAWDDLGGGQGSAQNSDLPIQGSETRARRVDAAVRGFGFDNGAGIDISAAGVHVGMWFNVLQPGLIGANGAELSLSDSGTNCQSGNWDGHRYFSADYPATGGWVRAWLDPTRTPEVGAGTLSLSGVRNYGIEFDMGNVGGNAANCHIDRIDHTASGLTLSGGTSGDPAVFADLSAYDETNAVGIFDGDFLNGPITLGGASSHFEDSNFAIKAGNQPLAAAGWIEITADLTSATSVVNFPSGFFSGIGFVVNGTGGTADWGSTVISNAPAITLTSAVALSGSLVASATLTSGGAVLDGLTVDGGTDTVGVIVSSGTVSSLAAVRNCNRGQELTGAGPFTVIGTQYANNTIDIRVNDAGDVTVNLSGGANATTCENIGAGNCTLVSSISWTIAGLPVGAELTITDTAATPNVLFHIEATVTGTEVYSFDGADAGNDVVVLVVPDPATDGALEAFDTDQSLPAADVTLQIDLLADRVYSNPL